MEHNDVLLSILNDMIGKDVTVTGVDGTKHTGILTAISDAFAFGLKFAYEITPENEKNILPRKSEVVDKLQFNFSDVVGVAARSTEDRTGIQSQKFATDRAYHGNTNPDEDLEEWNPEDDEGVGGSIEDNDTSGELADQRARRNGNSNPNGWSVDDMFKTNEKLHVVSSFDPNMSQYTTCRVQGTNEQRAIAEKLAREIENSAQSRMYARLENDDIERDLDKETDDQDFETVGLNHKRGGKNSAGFTSSQNRRNPNLTPNGQPINRRADGLKSDRRNSGGAERINQNRYQNQGGLNTSQSSSSNSKGNQQNQYNNRRHEELPQQAPQNSRNDEWKMSKGKNNTDPENKYQPKEMLETKPMTKQHNVVDRKESTPSSSATTTVTTPVTPSTTGNAWNCGPPKSLVQKGQNEESTTSSVSTPSTSSAVGDDFKTIAGESTEKASTSGPNYENASKPNQENGNDTIENVMTQSTTESDTASNCESSKSFKFNVNAPEFRPRMTPTTPQPGTPTGQMTPQMPIPPQQFVQEYGHGGPVHPGNVAHPGVVQQAQIPQQMAMQGAQMALQGQHMMANNVVPGQGMVVWPQNAQYQQYQLVPMTAPQGGAQLQRGPPHGAQMYSTAVPTATSTTTSAGQAPNNRRPAVYPQQWVAPNAMMMPQNVQYFNQQHQYPGQQVAAQQYQMNSQGQLMSGPPPPQQQGGQGGYNQANPRFQQQQHAQMYMTQGGPPGGQRGPYQPGPPQSHDQQQQQQFANQGAQQSHPNSQPPTPGPQQQQPQTAPSPAQNLQAPLRQGAESGSSGSLNGSAGSQQGAQRSVSPANQPQQQSQQQQQPQQTQGGHQQPPTSQLMNMPPPPQQQMQYMHVGQQPGPHQMHQMHQGPPGGHAQYYQSPVYYQQGMVYPQQHGMQMQATHAQHAQMMGGEHVDNGMIAQPYDAPYTQFVPPNSNPYYQPQQAQQQQQQGAMSRQNSLPHQQGGPQGQQQYQQGGGQPQQQQQQGGGQPPSQGIAAQQGQGSGQ